MVSSYIMTLTTMLLLLVVTIIRSEDSAIQPEVEDDDNLRHYQREWPSQITPAVFPEDSSVAVLALPGSQPIRPRNTYRRRRKRPRPQSSSTYSEDLEDAALPYKEKVSHYQPPQEGYLIYEPPVNIRESEAQASYNKQHQPRPQRRRPNSSQHHKLHPPELPHIPVKVDSTDIQIKTEEDFYQSENGKPEEQPVDISQEEHNTNGNDRNHSDSQSFDKENSYIHRGHRDDQYEEPRDSLSTSEVTNSGFKPQLNMRNIAYRKPYPARSPGHNNDAIASPQDIKALLKQQSGSLSLSELLQQKNLSLADLLKGNRNALSALTGGHHSTESAESKTADINQETVPPRRLPPAPPLTNSRRKSQGTGHHQKPQRYSAKQGHFTEDYGLESTKHRRLPPVNIPSRQTLPSVDTDKPTRYQVQELEVADLDTREHINKFIPSSPRRPPPPEVTFTSDTTLTSSTESIKVTNSVIQDLISEDHNTFPDSLFNVHNEKHDAIQTENEEIDNLGSETSTTEHNVINPPVLESSHKNSQDNGTKPNDTTDHRPAPVPLIVQETTVIDPVHNLPEVDNIDQKAVDHNRLRGKYIPRHRISVAQKNNSSIEDTPKTERVRLPPPNVFLSPLRSRILNRTTSTKDSTVGTTVEPVQFISYMPQTSKTVSPAAKFDLTTEIISTTVGEDIDEPFQKVIPINTKPPSSQSQENSETRTTNARDEILEFLKTDVGSVRLARILASRNMTLAELIEHRERGSSQQHLAEIFRESGQPTESDNSEPNHDIINEEERNNIIRNFQQTMVNIGTNIPSIQEMFSFLEDVGSEPSNFQKHNSNHERNQKAISQEQANSQNHSIEGFEDPEGHAEQTPLREPQVFETLSSFPLNPPTHNIPHVPTLRSPSIPSQKTSYQHPATIYSFDPTNPYFSSGHRPIITSRLTTPTPATPLPSNDITQSIVLLQDIGQVRELASTGVGSIKGPNQVNRDEDKRFDVIYREDLENDSGSDGGLSTDVKSTIIVSSAILGLAILGFLAIFVVCRWRQKQARRRFVDGIVTARARSPILMQPEEKNTRQSLNPVLVNTRDLYKRDVSLDGEDDSQNPGARRYYLWRTIRKTLRYK